MNDSRWNRTIGRYGSATGLGLALLFAAAEALSGPGSRWGWWHYRTGLGILGISAIGGAVAAVVSLISGILAGPDRTAYRMAIAGIVIGLVAAGIPWSWSQTAKQVPKIHDISTDTVHPPQFVGILPLRKNSENPSVYGGPAVAALQSIAYPDIGPAILSMPAQPAFDRALKIARDMGWEIVEVNREAGRIEATAITFWFGFRDDVVVRVSPVPEGSRIDVRSVSRVGKGDAGTNAKRVRAFLEEIKKPG